jgi:hypothetical protein
VSHVCSWPSAQQIAQKYCTSALRDPSAVYHISILKLVLSVQLKTVIVHNRCLRCFDTHQVRWILAGDDCSNADYLATSLAYTGDGIATRTIANNGGFTAASFQFPVSLAGSTLQLCYSHGAGAEPYREYPHQLKASCVVFMRLYIYNYILCRIHA